jgi:hypothetical protein
VTLKVGAWSGPPAGALRRGEDPALRLRPLQERHHQPRVRAPGRSARPDRRQDPAPLRRQGGEERRLHPVRRLARREPPAPLLAHLLHGFAQADAVRARGLRRPGQVDHLLHRHPRHRPLRGLLPDGAEGCDRRLRQEQGRAHRPQRPRTATRSCTASTPRATSATPPSTTWSCWPSAWSPRSPASSCPTTSSSIPRTSSKAARRRHVRRRRRGQPARRQSLGAERHGCIPARDPGHP